MADGHINRNVASLPICVFVCLGLSSVARDATSHNLWPFEIVIAGALSAGLCLVLAIAHRFLAQSDR